MFLQLGGDDPNDSTIVIHGWNGESTSSELVSTSDLIDTDSITLSMSNTVTGHAMKVIGKRTEPSHDVSNPDTVHEWLFECGQECNQFRHKTVGLSEKCVFEPVHEKLGFAVVRGPSRCAPDGEMFLQLGGDDPNDSTIVIHGWNGESTSSELVSTSDLIDTDSITLSMSNTVTGHAMKVIGKRTEPSHDVSNP